MQKHLGNLGLIKPSSLENKVLQGRESGAKSLSQMLVVRIAFLLSLALLPIGLVAMGQSWRALHTTHDNLEASIHARTSALVEPERRELLTKLGTAAALADTLGAATLGTETCTAIMQRVQSANPRLAFAGLLEKGSVSDCNSMGRRFNFLPDSRSDALFSNPEPYITFSAQGAASELPVIIVAYPTFAQDETLKGFVTISFETEPLLGSRLIEFHSQNKTVAASMIAEKKVSGHRSYRVATRRQSFNRPNMISMRLRRL